MATAPKYQNVDAYLATLPPASKTVMETLRSTIRSAAPEAEEKISYNMPSFEWNGGLVWYAAWKKHVSLYPWSDAMVEAIEALKPYTASKGTIQFPLNQPLPLDLVAQIVQFRIQENKSKTKSKTTLNK